MSTDSREGGFVYLFRMGEFYKIGCSTDVGRRVGAFSNLPAPVEVIHQFASANHYKVESALHRRFAAVRTGGEWFLLGPEDVALIASIRTANAPADLPGPFQPPSPPPPPTRKPPRVKGPNYGHIIKAAREAKGWTTGRLASEAGVSQSQISRVEAGRRTLTLESAKKVAAALGVSMSVFDAGEGVV